jgi:Flp pilus assembly protein TadD
MKKTSQDIYGTNRKKEEVDPLSDQDRYDLLQKPWLDARRQHRRATITLTIVVFVILALIATVVVQQYFLTKQSTGKGTTSKAVPEKTIMSSSFNVNTDTQTQFMMDELSELKNITLPEKGDMPLNTQWIKQAAYYLIQAEKAAREERFDDAIDSYGKALLIYPKLQGAHRQLGLAYLRKKDYQNAAPEFEKASAEEAMTYGLANNLGVSYLALEDYKKAENSFLMATQLNPQYALAYFNLATLYLRTGDPTKAAGFFEKYLSYKPEDVAAAQTYAMVLVQLKRWDQAAGLLQQIATFAPDVAPIHFRLAEALSHTTHRDAAIESLKRAVSLVDPRQALAWMSRPEYDLLRNEPGFRELLNDLSGVK